MEAAREGHEEMVALLLAQGKQGSLLHFSECYTPVSFYFVVFIRNKIIENVISES